MEEKREEKLDRQTNDILQEYGRFMVEFEQMVFAMRTTIIVLLSFSGLKNQQLSNILLAEHTAYPLKSILQSLVGEIFKPEGKDKVIFDSIFKEIGKLIEERNDIVHGTLFVGWAGAEQTDFDKADGHKIVRKKDGAGLKGFEVSAVSFRDVYNRCKESKRLINCIIALCCGGTNIEFLISNSN